MVIYFNIFMQTNSTLTRFKDILNPKRNSLYRNNIPNPHKQHISQIKHVSMTETSQNHKKKSLAITINNFKQMKMPDAFSLRLSELPNHNWIQSSPIKTDTKQNFRKKIGKKYRSRDIDIQGLMTAIQRNKWLLKQKQNGSNYLIAKQMKTSKRYQMNSIQQQRIQKQKKYSFDKYENWSSQPAVPRKISRNQHERYLSNLFPHRNQSNQLPKTDFKQLRKKISMGQSLAPWETPDLI